jgi:hypothetical protein
MIKLIQQNDATLTADDLGLSAIAFRAPRASLLMDGLNAAMDDDAVLHTQHGRVQASVYESMEGDRYRESVTAMLLRHDDPIGMFSWLSSAEAGFVSTRSSVAKWRHDEDVTAALMSLLWDVARSAEVGVLAEVADQNVVVHGMMRKFFPDSRRPDSDQVADVEPLVTYELSAVTPTRYVRWPDETVAELAYYVKDLV